MVEEHFSVRLRQRGLPRTEPTISKFFQIEEESTSDQAQPEGAAKSVEDG